MPTMSNRYRTDTPLAFKGRGEKAKKEKKVQPLPPDSKIRAIPLQPSPAKKPGPAWSIKPSDPKARKKRKGLSLWPH